MPGRPGTPRFGVPKDLHTAKPDVNGRDVLPLQVADDHFNEQHQLLNPAQLSRTPPAPPGKAYVVEDNQYEAPCNHDDYEGGDAHISQLDEFKVLRNTVLSVKVKFSDDMQHIHGSDEATA